MNLVNIEKSPWLPRMEKMFFLFSLWFVMSALVMVAPLLFSLISQSAKGYSGDILKNENWFYNFVTLVFCLKGAFFSFSISGVIRRILKIGQRYSLEIDQVIKYTCGLFIFSALLSMGLYLNTYFLDSSLNAFGMNNMPFWRRFYFFVSGIAPQLFDILLAVAFYVFYNHFESLKKFEEEVI